MDCETRPVSISGIPDVDREYKPSSINVTETQLNINVDSRINLF